MTKRLKILISAYACSPIRGSEPGMGWGFVSALAKHHDLWVITEKEKFQKEIEAALAENPELTNNINFFFIQKKRHRRLRKIWPPSYYWFYKEWHKNALQLALKLHNEIHFDIVHQLNMVGFREPGYLWRLNAPFVWGPIGGFVQMPLRFCSLLGLYGTAYSMGRNIFNAFQAKILKRPYLAAKKAGSGLIAATSDTAEVIHRLWGKNSHIMCEVGLPPVCTKSFRQKKRNEPLKIVWSGLHIPRKALPLLLKALALIPTNVKWSLDVLGKGRETANWGKLAKKIHINDNCHWHGWVAREKSLEIMKNGHVFVVSSLQDLTSTVIIEALSLGLPVICLDHCGFSDVITPECGIKIPVTHPEKVINGISQAIMRLEENESLRQKMASAAISRAAEFSWDKKAQQLNKIYFQVKEEWHSESPTRT